MTEMLPPRVGDPAPDVSLPDLEGTIVTLSAVRRTAHVVVHFVREFT